jgi:Ca2+-binding EF-hand superfamily protein
MIDDLERSLDTQMLICFSLRSHAAGELCNALSNGGNTFDSSSAKVMIKMFDRTGTRTIDIHDYVNLHRFISVLTSTFTQYDTDRNGMLSVPEVQAALTRLGFGLDATTSTSLCKKFDPALKGVFTFPTFVEVCCFMGNVRTLLEYFDTDRDGKITLDFAQLTSLSLNILPDLSAAKEKKKSKDGHKDGHKSHKHKK